MGVRRNYTKWALFMTATAMVADFGVNVYFTVNKRGGFHRAVGRDNALFTAATLFLIGLKNALTDYAEVVKVGLYAVVRTAAHGNFKLVWQCHIAVSHKKSFVNFLA